MTQSFRVVRCYQCETFQVDIEKKASKWQCKICQEKQSLKQVYHRGSGLECRKAVQQLNLKRRDQAVRQEEQISYRPDEPISYGEEEQIPYRQEEQISYRQEEQISYRQETASSLREGGGGQQTPPASGHKDPAPPPASSHKDPAPPPAKTSRWAKFLPPETRYSDEEEDEEDFLVPQQSRKVPKQPSKVPHLPRKRKSSEAAGVKMADGGPGKWGRFQL